LTPTELLKNAKPIDLDARKQRQKYVDLSNRRVSRRRSEVPSLILEVNILPDEELATGENADPKHPLPFWRRYFGIFLALMSSIVFSMTTLLVKILSVHYHPVNFGVWRFQGIFTIHLGIFHKIHTDWHK